MQHFPYLSEENPTWKCCQACCLRCSSQSTAVELRGHRRGRNHPGANDVPWFIWVLWVRCPWPLWPHMVDPRAVSPLDGRPQQRVHPRRGESCSETSPTGTCKAIETHQIPNSTSSYIPHIFSSVYWAFSPFLKWQALVHWKLGWSSFIFPITMAIQTLNTFQKISLFSEAEETGLRTYPRNHASEILSILPYIFFVRILFPFLTRGRQ